MKFYQLTAKDHRFTYYGTAQEIWEHINKQGYKGETQIVDGYPIPAGEDFVLEGSHIKKTSSLRLAHQQWAQMDALIGDPAFPRINNRVDVIEFVMNTIDQIKAFGPVYATTPEGIRKYDNIMECVGLLPYFQNLGFSPVIAREERQLEDLE